METTQSNIPSGNGSDKATTTNSTRSMQSDMRSATAQRTGASLRSELASLKSDLDALVNRAPNLSDEELAQAHARMMQQFSSLRFAAKGIADQASRQLNRGMESTTEYVKDKPMQSLAVAAGAGLLLGLLFRR